MNRRQFLGLVGAATAAMTLGHFATATQAVPTATSPSTSPTKPNFLIISADDLSPDHLGCYGTANANTPNIDALASSGVMFQTCWATPMCAPSRAMLVTGRYAHRTGCWHNGLNIQTGKLPPDQFASEHLTFARVLKEAGYATAVAGKTMELGGAAGSRAVGFDEYCVHEPSGNLPAGKVFQGLWESEQTRPGHKGRVASRYWHPCVVRNGQPVETGPDDFGDDIFADFLIGFMRRKSSQPFLAYFSMNLPHGVGRGEVPTTPLSGRPGKIRGGTMEECVAYIDVLVGKLLKALDELGLRENTLVIFTSDNSDALRGKDCATDLGARVPMVISGASWVKARGPTAELMSVADVFPTIVELAGAKVPPGYETDGQSLAAYLRGQSNAHRQWVYSYIGTARMVRDKRWLLEGVDPIGGSPKGRLYDCGNDREGTGYKEVSESQEPEVLAARKRLEDLLARMPGIDPKNPAAAVALQSYAKYPFVHRLTNMQ